MLVLGGLPYGCALPTRLAFAPCLPGRVFEGSGLHTICIVDDDDAVRDSMRELLESHMMNVRDYDSGNSLLAAGDLDRFDCFVLDFQMPGMNGLELAEALRDKGVGSAKVLVSALRIAASDDRMRRAGIVAALMKPVAENDLIGCIRQAMEPSSRH